VHGGKPKHIWSYPVLFPDMIHIRRYCTYIYIYKNLIYIIIYIKLYIHHYIYYNYIVIFIYLHIYSATNNSTWWYRYNNKITYPIIYRSKAFLQYLGRWTYITISYIAANRRGKGLDTLSSSGKWCVYIYIHIHIATLCCPIAW
jgi:hypothetical protein